MKLKISKDKVTLNSKHTLSAILLSLGFIALLMSFNFSSHFLSHNPNFIYVWLYSSFILMLLGGFLDIYQKRNTISFDLNNKTIHVKELYSGKRGSFSISTSSIKEFHFYQRFESVIELNKYIYELHIVDLNNNNFILAELSETKKIKDLAEIIAVNYGKEVHVFCKTDAFDSKLENIHNHSDFQENIWGTTANNDGDEKLIPELQQIFKCKKTDNYEKVSWSFRQQTILALISSLLGIGLVLIFSMIIIPLKGYNLSISLGLIVSSIFLFSSLALLIYTYFAYSEITIYEDRITFEIYFLKYKLFRQCIIRENVLHIAGSFDSTKRNELVLLSKKGFELIYNRSSNKHFKINDDELKRNVSIIDTRPLLSAERYFLYEKLRHLLN